MNSRDRLAKELQVGTWEHFDEWKSDEKAPFKYRILFSTLVDASTKLFSSSKYYNRNFYYIYCIISMALMASVPLVFHQLLKIAGFNNFECWLGIFFLFISPAFLLAYTLPVHTKEDMLGYLLLCSALIFLIKEKDYFFCMTAILGVITRETLMVLPFIYLFFSKASFSKKIVICSLPILSLILLRLSLGLESYNMAQGFSWNVSRPFQILGFGFLCFHILWAPFFLGLSKKKSEEPNISFFRKSALPVITLIIMTTFLFGQFNEIRLQFLGFPWIIINALMFFRLNRLRILDIAVSSKYKIYITFIISLFTVFIIGFIKNYEGYFSFENRYNVPVDLWLIVLFIFIGLQVIILPFLTSSNNSFKLDKANKSK